MYPVIKLLEPDSGVQLLCSVACGVWQRCEVLGQKVMVSVGRLRTLCCLVRHSCQNTHIHIHTCALQDNQVQLYE